MILISHRGNTRGPNPTLENFPPNLEFVMLGGFHVEIDLWFVDGKWLLGHDCPQYDVSLEWLETHSSQMWVHCKNIDAMVQMAEMKKFNFFWHKTDTVTLTSHGYVWAFPGKQPIKNSIAVLPEINHDDVSKCQGICSDFIASYK